MFIYCEVGRVTQLKQQLEGEGSLSDVKTYRYDAMNRITQVTDEQLGKTISYSYDNGGNRTSMVTPDYEYDAPSRTDWTTLSNYTRTAYENLSQFKMDGA